MTPQLSTGEYDIFFSHRWANKPFLSHLHHLLCEHGYRVWYVHSPAPHYTRPHRSSPSCAHSSLSSNPSQWVLRYDANEMGFDLVTSMTQGIQKSTVVLCCVDSEYSKSTNCMLELRHAAKVMPIYLGPYLSPFLGPYIAPYACSSCATQPRSCLSI